MNNRGKKNNGASKVQSLNAKIARISKEINPSGTVRSAPPHPKAIRTSRHKWIQRKVRVVLYQSAAAEATLTTAKIVGELNDSTADDAVFREFCVKKVTAWNTTNPGQTSNYIRGRTSADMTTNGVEIYAEDYGTGTSLPGFVFEIPDALSKLQKASTSSTTTLASFVTYPLGGDLTTKQTIVVDVDLNILVL